MVEDIFRSAKSLLATRPIFHKYDETESLLVVDQFQAPRSGLISSAGCSSCANSTRNRCPSLDSIAAFNVSMATSPFSEAPPPVEISSGSAITKALPHRRAVMTQSP
jgi:hypothetical protein